MPETPFDADDELREAIANALGDARRQGHEPHPWHVARRLLTAPSVYRLVEPGAIKAGMLALDAIDPPFAAADLNRLFAQVQRTQANLRSSAVTPRLLLAVMLMPGVLTDRDSLRVVAAVATTGLDQNRLLQDAPEPPPNQLDFVYAPLGFGTDLSAQVRAADAGRNPVLGREEVIDAALNVLDSGWSVCLTGLAGVGKTSVVEGMAWLVARGLHGGPAGQYRFISFDAHDLVARTGLRGELEERVGRLIAHVASRTDVIPFFDELHALLGGGDESSRKIGDLLKKPLASRSMRCVGATTDHEYVRYIAKDGALNRRFQPVAVLEPGREQTLGILRSVRDELLRDEAGEARVTIPDKALGTAVDLSVEHYRDEALPSKAIKLLRAAASRKVRRVRRADGREPLEMSEADVAQVVSEFRKIPVQSLTGDRVARFVGPGGARERLSARVVGQDHAIHEATAWLALHADGCTEPRAPIGRFLFLGRPGCGKTELARALAAELAGDGGAVIEKPMGQYQTDAAQSLFMGSSPGYVGFGETNTLFSQVRMRPYAVVVLDEIEKAHASLMPILLSVLDGYAEDGQGIPVNFSQCVFVLTSNALADPGLTADEVRAMASSQDEKLRASLLDREVFPGPLIDRLDRVVFFNPLGPEQLAGILRLKIDARRAANPRAIPDGFEERLPRIVDETLRTTGGSGRDLTRVLLRHLREAKEAQWKGGPAAAAHAPPAGQSAPRRGKRR